MNYQEKPEIQPPLIVGLTMLFHVFPTSFLGFPQWTPFFQKKTALKEGPAEGLVCLHRSEPTRREQREAHRNLETLADGQLFPFDEGISGIWIKLWFWFDCDDVFTWPKLTSVSLVHLFGPISRMSWKELISSYLVHFLKPAAIGSAETHPYISRK